MGNLPGFLESNKALKQLKSNDTIASAHGILCALKCIDKNITLDNWLKEVTNDDIDMNNIIHKQSYAKLSEVFEMTKKQLKSNNFEFRLLIAPDDDSLNKRLHSLTQWCQGFLLGLGLAKIKTKDEDILEIIKDIATIARINTNIYDSEDNIVDFTEILEFIRVGVMLIYEDFILSDKS